MRTGLWTHEAFSGHVTPPGHPEQVARLAYVKQALSDGRFATLVRHAAPLAEDGAILRCHPQSYIDRIVGAEPATGWRQLDADTHMSPGSVEAARRAGIPTNLYSLTATYAFDNGIALSASGVAVDSVYSGQSRVVKLPSYVTADLGVSYETGPWLFRVVSKNVTNEKYFRANFTELFGSTIVLPEKPRSVQASVIYKF